MSVKVQITGGSNASNAFDRMIRAMENEHAFRGDMRSSLTPVRDTARQVCRKKSGKTAEDIDLRDAPSAPGVVTMALGAHKRSHVLTLLEIYGVGKGRKKYPALKPALDADNGGWMGRLADRVHARREAAANA